MPLVTTKEMFRKAYEGGYAIGAFNVNNMEIVQGITEAAQLEQAPVILQVSAGARKYAKHIYLTKLVEAAVADTDVPIALHLDHGDGFEICKDCIDGGFTSVMIDGSKLSFEENIAVTRKVVEYAHDHGVMVEGELGKLAGIEDAVNVSEADAQFTNPAEVEEFVSRTGVDSLAIAIGTSHGAYKFKPGQKPQLRFDILQQVSDRLPGFPIVLHGASSVIQADVETVNRFGGKMPDAIGIPEEMLRHAAEMAVCKINIDSDLRLAMTAAIRQHMFEHPDHFDPRQYLTPRPRSHPRAGPPQDARCPGLLRQGVIFPLIHKGSPPVAGILLRFIMPQSYQGSSGLRSAHRSSPAGRTAYCRSGSSHTVAVAVGGNGKNAAVRVIADIEGMAAQSQDALPYLPPRGGGIAYPYGAYIFSIGTGGDLQPGGWVIIGGVQARPKGAVHPFSHLFRGIGIVLGKRRPAVGIALLNGGIHRNKVGVLGGAPDALGRGGHAAADGKIGTVGVLAIIINCLAQHLLSHRPLPGRRVPHC